MKNDCLLRRVCHPSGLGELATFQVLPDHAPAFPRGAVRWFKTGRVILVLTGLLAVFVGVSPSLYAGVIFTAGSGNDTVTPNGTVIIPITVSGFANMEGAQFSLTWNAGGLVLSAPTVVGINSSLSGGSAFGFPGANTLTWLWSSAISTTVTDNTAIFSVEFTASGSAGASTAVSFGNTPTPIQVRDTSGVISFTVNNDNVTVVPEPINWALGLFACVFIGGATVRWVSNRRMALQSAHTVFHDEAGA